MSDRDPPLSSPSGLSSRQQQDYAELSRSLRELAQRLVEQEATADDLVQEAWLASLEHPPQRIRDLNSWLRKVVRNVAARNYRRSSRRRELELGAARPEGIETEDTALGRASLSQVLHESVATLREPYRSVLTRRFFEQRSVAEVAQELGHSPATVRSQVGRGLAELRQVLDRKHGGRRESWLPALAVLARDGAEARALATSTGAGAALWPAWLAVGGLTLGLALWFGFRTPDELRTAQNAGRLAAQGVSLSGSDDTESGNVPSVQSGARAELREPALQAAASTDATIVASELEFGVRVRRADGSLPLDARVRVWGRNLVELGEYPADEMGHATIRVAPSDLMRPPQTSDPNGGVYVAARDRDEAWSYQYRVDRSSTDATRTVQVRTRGPALELRVVVRDESGARVPRASVLIDGSRGGLFSPEGSPMEESIEMYTTDERGELVLESMPRRVYRLIVRAPEFLTDDRTFQGTGAALEAPFVLSRGSVVYGQVHGPDGPVADARVWELDWMRVQFDGGRREVQSDENGFFALSGIAAGRCRLFARSVADPELFACEVLEVPFGEDVEWNPTLTPTPPVRLRVLDEKQVPIERAAVLLSTGDAASPWLSDIGFTAADGSISFLHCPPGELTAAVAHSVDPGETPSDHAVRAGQENVIQLEPKPQPGAFAGVLLDENGDPPANATLFGAFGKSNFDIPVAPETGDFLALDLLPGRYAVYVLSEVGVNPIGSHDLLPGAIYELGVVRLPRPVSVAFEWGEVVPSAAAPWEVICQIEGRPQLYRIHVLEHAPAELQLWQGSYRVQPVEDPIRGITFEVRLQAVTTVSVERSR